MLVRLLMLGACGTSTGEAALRLEGPSEVHVHRLGPVDGPRVVTDGGDVPDGVIVTLSRGGVARVAGDHVVAVGPGEVVVGAEWEGSRVEWVLTVDLDTRTVLTFVSPPSTLRVGVPVALRVAASTGGEPVPVGAVSWQSSDPAVVRIGDDGEAIGVAAGVAYLTARAEGASAMVEVEVVR
ncbi:MAG: hypothetical protein R3F59_09120 [Myxococcota bacterium]